MKPKKRGDFMKNMTIRLSDDLNDKLKRYADEQELSKNQVVKQALKRLFENEFK